MGRNMKKLAAAATVGLLALAGCTTGNPQTAAYIADKVQTTRPDTRVTIAQVDATSRALADVSSDTSDSAATFSTTVVQIMIQNEIAKRTAADNQITVTEEQRKQVLAANESLGTLMQNPALTSFISDYINTGVILSGDAGQAAAKDEVTKISIRLNPRYGTWDPQRLGIADGSTGSISEIAPIRQE